MIAFFFELLSASLQSTLLYPKGSVDNKINSLFKNEEGRFKACQKFWKRWNKYFMTLAQLENFQLGLTFWVCFETELRWQNKQMLQHSNKKKPPNFSFAILHYYEKVFRHGKESSVASEFCYIFHRLTYIKKFLNPRLEVQIWLEFIWNTERKIPFPGWPWYLDFCLIGFPIQLFSHGILDMKSILISAMYQYMAAKALIHGRKLY